MSPGPGSRAGYELPALTVLVVKWRGLLLRNRYKLLSMVKSQLWLQLLSLQVSLSSLFRLHSAYKVSTSERTGVADDSYRRRLWLKTEPELCQD